MIPVGGTPQAAGWGQSRIRRSFPVRTHATLPAGTNASTTLRTSPTTLNRTEFSGECFA